MTRTKYTISIEIVTNDEGKIEIINGWQKGRHSFNLYHEVLVDHLDTLREEADMMHRKATRLDEKAMQLAKCLCD